MKTLLLFICLIAALAVPPQTPIIGIYSQWDESSEPKAFESQNRLRSNENEAINSYIAASYVKFIEMSGAQVVPIMAYSDQAYFDNLLPKLNGVLFPGNDLII